MEALFRSEVFNSRAAYRALAKTPVEYAVGAIKALGAGTNAVALLPGRGRDLRSMGQVLFEPPNVAGWPGGRAWFTTSMLLARLNFLNQATGGVPAAGPPGAAPSASPLDGAGLASAAQVLDRYLPLVLDDNIRPEARRLLLEYAGGGAAALTPESLRDLVYLVLASPEFHLS
jgi:hypothetical protein